MQLTTPMKVHYHWSLTVNISANTDKGYISLTKHDSSGWQVILLHDISPLFLARWETSEEAQRRGRNSNSLREQPILMLVFFSGPQQSCSELPTVQSSPTEARKVTLHSWSYSWNHQDTRWAVKEAEAEVTCLNIQVGLNSVLWLWDSEHSAVCYPWLWELGCELPLESQANPKSTASASLQHLPAEAPEVCPASQPPTT